MPKNSLELEDNSHYRVALDLAEKIYAREHVAAGSTNLKKDEARKYWLSLYRQCFDVVANGDTYESVAIE